MRGRPMRYLPGSSRPAPPGRLFATCTAPPPAAHGAARGPQAFAALLGKVNMDRNSPDSLREAGAATALAETRRWLEESRRFARSRPILTPASPPAARTG